MVGFIASYYFCFRFLFFLFVCCTYLYKEEPRSFTESFSGVLYNHQAQKQHIKLVCTNNICPRDCLLSKGVPRHSQGAVKGCGNQESTKYQCTINMRDQETTSRTFEIKKCFGFGLRLVIMSEEPLK